MAFTGRALPPGPEADGAVRCNSNNSGCGALGNVSKVGLASVGEPINPATGNVTLPVTDYTTKGTNPLAAIRSYNSMTVSRTNMNATTLGVNWRTNYDRYLYIPASGTAVAAQRPNGQVVNFYLISSVWVPDGDMDYTLTKSGTTYTLTDSDDTVETYTASGTTGTLNSIKLRNGYTQTMHYTSAHLTSVTDTYGRRPDLSLGPDHRHDDAGRADPDL